MSDLSLAELAPLLFLFAIIAALVAALQFVRNAPVPKRPPPGPQAPLGDASAFIDAAVPRPTPVRRRRGGLARMRRAVEESEEEDEITPQQDTRRKTKKEANREARREARLARLQQVGQVREREAQNEEIREDDGIREEELEKVREEKRKLVAEEKEKKEQEEYDNWRHLISVEEAGEDVGEAEKDDPRMLQKFCAYVKREKVVVLEDLAGEFHMKTEDVVDRLTSLQEDRQLTGFFDDRGKFIYVSKGEMEDVANFIRKRGRISIQELASETTSLLHLDDPERSLSSSFASDDSNDTLS